MALLAVTLYAMVGWFKGSGKIVLPAFVPTDAVQPFDFPVVEVGSDLTVLVHRSSATFGLVPEQAVGRGQLPKIRVFAACLRVWEPTRMVAQAPSGRVLLGHKLLHVAYEFAMPTPYELPALKDLILESVNKDPDDIWSQLATHEELIAAVSAARDFRALVATLLDHGC